jgi:hypothetical protein
LKLEFSKLSAHAQIQKLSTQLSYCQVKTCPEPGILFRKFAKNYIKQDYVLAATAKTQKRTKEVDISCLRKARVLSSSGFALFVVK